jgi:hypothetical protein
MIVLSRKHLLVLALILAALFTPAYIRLFTNSADSQIAHHDKDYVILIHVDEKRLYLLENGEAIKKYTVATGKSGFSSPIGDWKIVSKARNWGGGFGARWLGLNVTWGKYGIHGTNDEGRIGYAVSHGCIRMRNRDVIELYDMVSYGTPVIIRNGPYGPFGMGFKTLSPGQRGADVLAVQKKLKELGYFTGYESGIYNDSLKTALHQFQRANGLPVENKVTRDDYKAMGFIEFD